MSNPTRLTVEVLLALTLVLASVAAISHGQDAEPTTQPADATTQPADVPANGEGVNTDVPLVDTTWPDGEPADAEPELELFGLPGIQTEHYTIYSQLSEAVTEDVAFRLERMYEYYAERFADCYYPINFPLVVVLFNNRQSFVAAGGHPTMPGQFMTGHDGHGARLMMIFHEGHIGGFMSSCPLMYHEGFHQFNSIEISQAGNINRQWPLWLDESYATAFNNITWTGDGWVDGHARAEYAASAVDTRDSFIPLRELVNMDGARWMRMAGEGSVWPLYMEGWMFVHFLNNAEDGRYRELLADYVRQVSNGLDSSRSLRRIVSLQRRFGRWLEESVHPRMTGAKYFEIFAAMSTSLITRAHVRGQEFDDGDAFITALRMNTLNMPPRDDDQWLPDSLRRELIWMLDNMFQPFEISLHYPRRGDGPPTVRVAQPRYGLVLEGAAELDDDGKVLSVDVDYDECISIDLDEAEQRVNRRRGR